MKFKFSTRELQAYTVAAGCFFAVCGLSWKLSKHTSLNLKLQQLKAQTTRLEDRITDLKIEQYLLSSRQEYAMPLEHLNRSEAGWHWQMRLRPSSRYQLVFVSGQLTKSVVQNAAKSDQISIQRVPLLETPAHTSLITLHLKMHSHTTTMYPHDPGVEPISSTSYVNEIQIFYHSPNKTETHKLKLHSDFQTWKDISPVGTAYSIPVIFGFAPDKPNVLFKTANPSSSLMGGSIPTPSPGMVAWIELVDPPDK